MAKLRIPPGLRELIRQRAGQRCEYCQTPEWLSGLECEVDHIVPRAQGGPTISDNLCLACPSCNGHKLAQTHGVDPETGQRIPLYHPRRQRWHEHFAWSGDGTRILGLTDCGRATVETLHLNHPPILTARAIWVRTGQHPPLLPEASDQTEATR